MERTYQIKLDVVDNFVLIEKGGTRKASLFYFCTTNLTTYMFIHTKRPSETPVSVHTKGETPR